MKSLFAGVLLSLCLAAPVCAQAPSPASWTGNLKSIDQIASRSYATLDIERIAAEDAIAEAAGQPSRYAIPNEVSITPDTGGTWEQRGDTGVWRMRFESKGVASINFGFTRFHLPDGAALYIYAADDHSLIAGPYTSKDNEAHGQLWTPIIASDQVVVELDTPNAVRGDVELELGRVNLGYRGFGTVMKGYEQTDPDVLSEAKTCKSGEGRSGSCNTDVACLSDGDPWNDPRRSVGGVSEGGSVFCTGSLVNNTANDKAMLFMTASHCGIDSGSAPSLVVYWNYEWPTCRRPGAAGGTAANPPDPQITSSGAVFRAATGNPFGGCSGSTCSDNTLVELDDPADPDFDLYWAGWDRSEIGAVCADPADPTSTEDLCASIHHPNGDEKRISFVADDLTTANIAGAVGVHWFARWDQTPTQLPNFPAGGALPPSITEPGSSGSPLYTADQRLVGVLSGGASFCGASPGQLNDQYGKLAHAWEGTGTPTTMLRPYLDPLGTNPMFIDGIGGAPFALSADPAQLSACAMDDIATVTIGVTADAGFTDPVDLSASGQPPGSTANFSPNPVNPPGDSTLTLGNLGAATAGDYAISVTGTSGADTSSTTIALSLSSAALGATTLVSPPDGDPGQPPDPTLEWAANGDAVDYLVEVATDDQFTDIVFSQTVADATTVEIDPPLAVNDTYYWRVTANNGCGPGTPSAVFSFSVLGPDLIFANGFEELVDPDIVLSGPINHALGNTLAGTSINWISGEVIDDDPDPGYDINIYQNGSGLTIWWNYAPALSAGVASGSGSANLSVLASGAEIGPGSTFSTTNGAMTDWRAGATGYIGFRFDCSSLPTAPPDDSCYGYLHFESTGPDGYPATILDYAYNQAGEAIEIP